MKITRALNRIRVAFDTMRLGLTLIVTPHGTGRTIRLNLPGKVALLLVVAFFIFIVGLAFIGITYSRLATLAVETKKLRSENQYLRKQNEVIREIEKEIARIEEMRRQIESWAGVLSLSQVEHSSSQGEVAIGPSLEPRRYTYKILKPLFTWSSTPGMIPPVYGWISRGFIEADERTRAHPGVDIVAPRGTPVRSVLDGIVTFAGWDDIYGNLVVIRHNDSLSTVYGHNEEVLVSVGDSVKQGDVIARIGSTGKSTAPHLHFEVLKNDVAVDPAIYVNFSEISSRGNR